MSCSRTFAYGEACATHLATCWVEGHTAQRVTALHRNTSASAFAVRAFLSENIFLIIFQWVIFKSTYQIQSIRIDVMHIDGLFPILIHEVNLIDGQGAEQVGPPPIACPFQRSPWNGA
jgi:hypothetical protein